MQYTYFCFSVNSRYQIYPQYMVLSDICHKFLNIYIYIYLYIYIYIHYVYLDIGNHSKYFVHVSHLLHITYDILTEGLFGGSNFHTHPLIKTP